jgi:hypothetical protein
LESFSNSEDINRALENIKENIKTSAKECLGLYKLKQHTPWFDKERLHFLDQRKQWLQDPNQGTVDNLNHIRREASRHFRNKNKEYFTAKIDEPETTSKIKNIEDLYRGINDFKKGYQSRLNIVKDDKGDLVTDSHNILARWRNHFSQSFNVCGVSNAGRQKYILQNH